MNQGNGAHRTFGADVHAFYADYVAPRHRRWREVGAPPREFWYAAAQAGILGVHAPSVYGGTGGRFVSVVDEETARSHIELDMLHQHTAVAVPLVCSLGTPEQRARWLPAMVSGRTVVSVLTTGAPGATVARAVRYRNSYIVFGRGGFACPGSDPDLIVVPVSGDSSDGRSGVSLLAIDAYSSRLSSSRTQSTAGSSDWRGLEFGFDDVVVPADNLLGDAGRGLVHLTECAVRQRLPDADRTAVSAHCARTA